MTSDALSPARAALAAAVREIEAHQAGIGWDAPLALFALVRTVSVLGEPDAAALLDEEAIAAAKANEFALTVIEQENLPQADSLEEFLAQLAWPEEVDGAALSVERVILPPAAEEEAAAIDDEAERMAFLEAHPAREDVRMVVGVTREGASWCALRTRSHDDSASVVEGPEVVPGLVEALKATLV